LSDSIGMEKKTKDLAPQWQEIRRAILIGERHSKDAETCYRRAGLLLIKMREATPHGEWLPKLQKEKIDERQARRLIELAESDAGVRFRDICHPDPPPSGPVFIETPPGDIPIVDKTCMGCGADLKESTHHRSCPVMKPDTKYLATEAQRADLAQAKANDTEG